MDPKRNPFLDPNGPLIYSFCRVVFDGIHGPAFGVARIWYREGHPNAGHVEVELRDGPPVLVPVENFRFAPNWDVTPEEGRFTGAEFYQPQFMAGATLQDSHLFSRGHGVTVPSDLARLRELTATIEPGDVIGWLSHGCNEFVGDLVVTEVSESKIWLKNPKSGKAGKGTHPTGCTWPTTGEPEIGPQYAYEFMVSRSRGVAPKDQIEFIHVGPKRYGTGPGGSLTLILKGKGRL